MILVELEIENYKQYAGHQLIEFPSEGAVGIIGDNGAGKTTLFEAIEWCLYNPREIPNDELPPRGGVGDTKVKLTLEDPRDQVRYVIERTRRRRGVDAEIYLQDQIDVPIVRGTRDVTDYVTHRLIGLSHRAFVSTFFTRQKELTFFGNLRDTERRREVAQLLGFETIRAAQAIIGDERTMARNEAQALARQYEDESNQRDLKAELIAAEAAIVDATAAEQAALKEVETSDAALQASRRELERLVELERQHATISQEIERLNGDLRTARANQRNAEANLDRLANLDRDRIQLLPVAERVPALREAVLVHVANQRQYERAKTLDDAANRARSELATISPRASKAVHSVDISGLTIAGWHWSDDDATAPLVGLDRLLETIDGLDPVAESEFARALRDLAHVAAQRDAEHKKFTTYQKRLDQLQREVQQLQAEGDPRAERTRLEECIAAARQAEQEAIIAARQCKERQAELQRTVDAIAAAAKEPECPTCHRALSARDAELAIAPLRNQIADFATQQTNYLALAKQQRTDLTNAEQSLARVTERIAKLEDSERRVALGQEMAQEIADEVTRLTNDCDNLLHGLNRSSIPTEDEVQAASRRSDTIREIVAQRAVILSLREHFLSASSQEADALKELKSIGEVSYDADKHKAAEEKLNAAQSAQARLAQIDLELANRPAYENQRATAVETANRLTNELRDATERRDALNFQRPLLEEATARERAAANRLREADRAVSIARGNIQAATRDRDAIIAEQERLSNLARRSEIRRRECDELERMYREFSRFDQYVAQLVTPQLADYTGELLAEVTDHKYDHVLFDDNYGVRIYDGPESFPIDQFSGGERDVAALCARLALSRFIGAQAAHPPRFLVLDEVFGSLDADRRTQVLNALLKLAGNDGPFRQLFIISHVDDVRASASFDEVWRVQEVDGASMVENLSRSGAAAEF